MLKFRTASTPTGTEYSVADEPGPSVDGWPKRLRLQYDDMDLRLIIAKNGMCVMGGVGGGEFSMGCVSAVAHSLVSLGEQFRIEEMRFMWLIPRMGSLIERIAQRAVEMEPRISLHSAPCNTIIARRTDWGDSDE